MANINLITAWVWIGLGFLSGLGLGLGFDREHWLGGYASWKRRLYRLGHISFFGLGMVNLLFYFTARTMPSGDSFAAIASIGFVAGAFTMPVCCLVMAHFPKAKMLFALPVLSLLIAGGFTVGALVRSNGWIEHAAVSRAHFTPQDSESNAATTALAANGL
ncbi:MAG: hypothetical protein JWO95_3077 [Verrucomicrobiales bacterium]|nr:hypothetical protein [Verrucomicrobiales bacterium]